MQKSYPYQGVEHLIIDIDHVINHYDSVYAEKFSIATASSFTCLNPQFRGFATHFDNVELAKKSYRETGRTTALFSQQFGIDEMALYQHHHDYMAKDGGFIEQQFNTGAVQRDSELPGLLTSLRSLGVKIYALTNGTENYARMVLGNRGHGISQYFTDIAGIDSIDNPQLNDKRHGAFIADILDKWSLLKRFPDAKGDKFSDFHHGTIALIDDSDANHRAPRFRFNMVTILPLNNSAKIGVYRAQFLAQNLNEILRDVVRQKKAIVKSSRLSF